MVTASSLVYVDSSTAVVDCLGLTDFDSGKAHVHKFNVSRDNGVIRDPGSGGVVGLDG